MGRESPVKVEYTLTPEDYVAAVHEHVQNTLGKPRRAPYASMAAIFPALLSLLSLGAVLVAQGFPWPVVAGVSPFSGLLGGFVVVLLSACVFMRSALGL